MNYFQNGKYGPYYEFYLPDISSEMGAVACINKYASTLPTFVVGDEVMLFILKNKPPLAPTLASTLNDLVFAGSFKLWNVAGDFDSLVPTYKEKLKFSTFSDFAQDKNYQVSDLVGS